MKKIILSIAAVMTLGFGAASMQAAPQEMGPGIVMAGSSSVSDLPQPALKFLSRHFKGVNVSKVDREYAQRTFEVDLENGVEIEFSNSGKVLEIDAPEGYALNPQIVKGLVGRKMFGNLVKSGSANKVNSIDFTESKGKRVKVKTIASQPQKILFDLSGNILLIQPDD